MMKSEACKEMVVIQGAGLEGLVKESLSEEVTFE